MNKIKELRKKHQLTQTELAQICNTTTSNISGWECNKWQPDIENLKQLSRYFNVSVDFLIGNEEILPEERAAGASETKKISITPLEDEMLYVFRQIGKKHGIEAQHALITVAEKML